MELCIKFISLILYNNASKKKITIFKDSFAFSDSNVLGTSTVASVIPCLLSIMQWVTVY